MAEVTLTGITKRFGEFTAVDDITMSIEDGKFTVLVGPSGCGKTTTLRMVAGLEETTAGEICIGDRAVNRVPPKDRDIAMVFQNYALYPHMDVYSNMAFGLKLRKYPKDKINERVHEAAELLEPLSNLDAKLRVQMRTELEELHHKLQTTTIYVTHDQVEAMTLGDRIAVMKDGVIQQYASPQETYDRPSNQFVAGFIGSPAMNLFPASAAYEDNRTILSGEGFRIALPAERSVDSLPSRVIMGVRPEDLEGPASDTTDVVTFKVIVKEQLGHSLLVYGHIEEKKIVASLDPHSAIEIDSTIHLKVNLQTLHVFDPETGRTLL